MQYCKFFKLQFSTHSSFSRSFEGSQEIYKLVNGTEWQRVEEIFYGVQDYDKNQGIKVDSGALRCIYDP